MTRNSPKLLPQRLAVAAAVSFLLVLPPASRSGGQNGPQSVPTTNGGLGDIPIVPALGTQDNRPVLAIAAPAQVLALPPAAAAGNLVLMEPPVSAPSRAPESQPPQAPAELRVQGANPGGADAAPGAKGSLTRLDGRLGKLAPAEHSQVLNEVWDANAGNASNVEPTPSGAPRAAALARRPLAAPIRNLTVRGVSAGVSQVAEGEALVWTPRQGRRDPYASAPGDDKKTAALAARNESAALKKAWLERRASVSPAVADRIDSLVARAEGEIARDGLKADAALEAVSAATKASPDPASRQAAEFADGDLAPAVRNRSELLSLTDDGTDPDLATFREELTRREKDLVMTHLHERFLRFLYGFDVPDPASAKGERGNAESRRLAMDAFFPLILAQIDAGMTAERALDAVQAKLKDKIVLMKARVQKNPNDALAKKVFTFYEEMSATFDAVKSGLRNRDDVDGRGEPLDVARAKREAELSRHEKAWARVSAEASGASEPMREILGEFDAHARTAVLREGRSLQHAAAGFFSRHRERLEQLNAQMNGQNRQGPLDLLMLYSYLARGGGQASAGGRDLVIIAPEIRDEADYQDLRLSFRGRGRVAGIVTLGAPDKDGASRMPHWVIFAKADGIVPLPWARPDAAGLSFTDLARRLTGPDGKPATAVVNGRRGEAILNPSETVRGEWIERSRTYAKLNDYYRSRAALPASFLGIPIRFLADESDPKAFAPASGRSAFEGAGASGIGLLRMEKFVSELGAERDRPKIAAGLAAILSRPKFRDGAPLTVRLFDFEGDKVPKFLRETRPDEVRALLKTHSNVRLYLDEGQPEFREFGKLQLKALFDARLRSGPKSDVRILFSNVQTAGEVRGIERLVDEAAAEYADELPQGERAAAAATLARIPIGYMVEDVETVKNLKPLMAEIDALRGGRPAARFLAMGTNDYQSSLLRDDPDAVEKLSKLDPRLVQGVWSVASAASARGLDFTVDGEWGSSPKLLLALLALRAYHGVNAAPVVYSERAPELHELIRSAQPGDLEALKSLSARLQSPNDAPTMTEFDAAAAAAVRRIEDRILDRLSKETP